jgi:uncharacterized protein
MPKARPALEARIRALLAELNSRSNSIEASAVMSRDGITLGAVFDARVDLDRLGAMCASMLSLGDRAANELARGKLRQLLLDGELGYLLITHVGAKAVLAVVSRQSSNLGMVFVEARETAAKLEPLLRARR